MTESITKQQLVDASQDAETLEQVVNGPSGELIKTRLGRDVYTLASVPQINTMTREEVVAAVAPKANQTYVDEQLSTKAPQATTYTKIEVDNALSTKAPQSSTYTKAEVDTTFAAYVGGRKAYTTLALAQAAQSSLPANTAIEVTNDPTASNNGTYQWNGTTLTKSAYDSLTQAKADATTKANAAEANAKSYTDGKTNHTVKYIDGNMVGSKTIKYLGKGLNNAGVLVTSPQYDMILIPVSTGQELYVLNDVQNYAGAYGYTSAMYTDDPTLSGTRIVSAGVQLTDTVSNLKYLKWIVPAGAKYLVLNSRFTTTNVAWAVHENAFSTSYVEGTPQLVSFNSAIVSPYDIASVIRGKKADGNLYDKTKDGRLGVYLSTAIPTAIAAGQAGWKIGCISVRKGAKYYFKYDGSIAFPFRVGLSEDAKLDIVNGKATTFTTITPVLVDPVNMLYEVTLPDSVVNPQTLVLNTIINTTPYTLDIDADFKIWESFIGSNNNLTAIDNFLGIPFKDLEARKRLGEINPNLITPMFKGKNIYTFGDSMTMGTQGGWQKYLISNLGCNIKNYGQNSAISWIVADIIMGSDGRGGTYADKDYSTCDVVTIMVGTNDYTRPLSYWDSASQIPNTSVYDRGDGVTVRDYFLNNYPSNYFATNIAAAVEYIRFKNPNVEIYLISSPPAGRDTSNLLQTYTKYYAEIAAKLSVTYLNATDQAQLSKKYIDYWSYDDLHFNTEGNKVYGNWLARKIASAG